MSETGRTDTHHGALQIDLVPEIFGTLAEIGAGQEVARWFLQVGGASGTAAKTISAFDMTVGDAIRSKGTRYVSRGRPNDVLLHVNRMDPSNLLQQQALGVLGVNLVRAACFERGSMDSLLAENVRISVHPMPAEAVRDALGWRPVRAVAPPAGAGLSSGVVGTCESRATPAAKGVDFHDPD